MVERNEIRVSKTILNEEERPRVLIAVEGHRREAFKFVAERPGSFSYVDTVDEIDLSEWDAIILDRQIAHAAIKDNKIVWWRRVLPLGINVFFVHDPDAQISYSHVIDVLVTDVEQDTPVMTITERLNVPGKHATKVDGLPADIQTLVNKVLVPLMAERDKQFGHDPSLEPGAETSGTHYRPFLIGPTELVIAASYRRGPNSDTWFIPSDVHDFEPWYDLALKDWHGFDKDRFPGAPDWLESDEWMTTEQKSVNELIRGEEALFAPILATHEKYLAELSDQLVDVRDTATVSEHRLLTAQGDALQEAVLEALEVLGFKVRDMDLEWDERERREDFRVTDDEAPEWIAIADATGVAKGVKGTKIASLGGFTTKYVYEESPKAVPSQWLLVNHFIDRDPNARQLLLRPDDLKVFAGNLGLAIDTVALFLLLQHVKLAPKDKKAVRTYLREATGQIGMKDAREWLSQNASDVTP